MTLKDALKSKLFRLIREGNLLKDDPNGGYILFEKKEEIEKLVKDNKNC
ncbi:MAG: hypothetical protein J6P02_06230 [Lachnospiraceae bacterium]|nr:hypothetical protein [Lachnospiraceae bacterium]